MENRRFSLGEVGVGSCTNRQQPTDSGQGMSGCHHGRSDHASRFAAGTSTVEVPQMKFEEAPSLTRRLQYVEEVIERFWNKWKKQVFQGLLLNTKWRIAKRNMRVGDVVMMLENEDDEASYRLAGVISVKPGNDGLVRTVGVMYTNPGRDPDSRSPPKITTRPIHKLGVVVPIDYNFVSGPVSEKSASNEERRLSAA